MALYKTGLAKKMIETGELYFQEIKVGEVKDIFQHQGTTFATFTSTLNSEKSNQEKKIHEFMTLMRRFNQECADSRVPRHTWIQEFEWLIRSPEWTVRSDTVINPLDGPPNPISETEISFILADT